ncbi:MAG TPA: PQQ-binding-like beta-propeller repeat protein [Terriglobales bacterium]|nr:PQQ-binding-like beta-propeller repeat protein [Terriglobales bacterium]
MESRLTAPRAASALFAATVAGLSIILLAASACRTARPNLAPRPEALGFPLMEAGALRFEGAANRPVRARYGEAYFTTDEGALYDIDVLSRRTLWTFRAEAPIPVAPELCGDSVVIRDERNTIYVIDTRGRLTFKAAAAGALTTAVRENGGRLYYGCGDGRVTAVGLRDGRPAWEHRTGSAVLSGPVFSGGLVVFGTADGRLLAVDGDGLPAWTFAARGAVRADPAAADGGLFFGTADGFFYGLAAATGKKRWAFRLAGEPLAAPVAAAGRRLVLAASDSVVYCLSARSGEILWWRGVPSRAVHAPAVADGLVIVSAFSPDVSAYDLRNGLPSGACRAGADLQAGAQWVTPYLVLIEPDPDRGGQRMVFLERDRRPFETLGQANPVRR